MKKLLFSLFIAFATFATTHAQLLDALQEHLTFKGVPINGSLKEYVAKMKTAGFTVVDTENGVAYLQGDFAGYKNCIIEVTTIKPQDIVNTINVLFPSRDEWSALESDYKNLKSMLTQKYGAPSDCKEIFTGITGKHINGTDYNTLKLLCLQNDECTWYTTFYTPNGDIKLSLEHRDSNHFVQLSYFDRLNSNAVRQQAINDL